VLILKKERKVDVDVVQTANVEQIVNAHQSPSVIQIVIAVMKRKELKANVNVDQTVNVVQNVNVVQTANVEQTANAQQSPSAIRTATVAIRNELNFPISNS
jgi:hypothetical protein